MVSTYQKMKVRAASGDEAAIEWFRKRRINELKLDRREYYKNYRKNNAEALKQKARGKYLLNREMILDKYRQSYSDKRHIYLSRNQKYRTNNKNALNERRRQKHSFRYENDLNYKISMLFRNRLKRAIRSKRKTKNVGKIEELIGCSISEFRDYLETKFPDGKGWSDWSLRGVHLDHILPLSSFDLDNPEELKASCHFSNFQFLIASDNLSKGSKLPFAIDI